MLSKESIWKAGAHLSWLGPTKDNDHQKVSVQPKNWFHQNLHHHFTIYFLNVGVVTSHLTDLSCTMIVKLMIFFQFEEHESLENLFTKKKWNSKNVWNHFVFIFHPPQTLGPSTEKSLFFFCGWSMICYLGLQLFSFKPEPEG